jgi:hypothetical protein
MRQFLLATSVVGLLIGAASAQIFPGSGGCTTSGCTFTGTVTAPTFSGALSGNATTATTAGNVAGTVAIGNGGTGATSAGAALTVLGAAPLASPTFTGTVTTASVIASGDVGSGAVALTDGASIATSCTAGNLFTVTLGGSRTLSNPVGCVSGHTYSWIVTQGSGGQTLAYGSAFKFFSPYGAASPPTLSAAASAVDAISCLYNGTSMLCAFGKGAS